MTLAELLFTTFVGRADIHAVADGVGFRPTTRALTAADLELHLSGQTCCGFYVMRPGNTVRTSAVDFDGKHEADWLERATNVADWLRSAGVETLLEVSQSGTGAHVWLFLAEDVDAWWVRAFWRWALDRAGVKCREIFPKQDRVAGKGMGNLIRYPLWAQSHFVTESWEPVEPDVALADIVRYAHADLEELCIRAGAVLRPDPSLTAPASDGGLPERVLRAVSRGRARDRWAGDATGLPDGSPSSVALSLCCHLIRAYIPTAEIEIALREWCERHNRSEKGQREDWVRRTVAAAYNWVLSREESNSTGGDTFRSAALEYLSQISTTGVAYCPFGIGPLDSSIDGVAPGEMCLVGARPSHGKSAFGVQWAEVQARAGRPVLFISEEMSARSIGKRCLSRVVEFDERSIVRPWPFADVAREAVERYYGPLAPIYVYQSCATIDRAEEVIEQAVALDGVRCVVVDYMQLLRSRAERKFEAVADVSTRMRQLTTRLGVAMLALVQLSREIDRRRETGGGGPRMSDIGDSGQLERDADNILFLRWPWKDDPDYTPADEYRVAVVKRRNGEIRAANVTCRFDSRRQVIV